MVPATKQLFGSVRRVLKLWFCEKVTVESEGQCSGEKSETVITISRTTTSL